MSTELIKALRGLWDGGNCSGLDGWVGPGRGTVPVDQEAVETRTRDVQKAADAIVAAGYRKPRLITTAEELDALEDGSVVLDASGAIRERYNDPDTAAALWQRPGSKGWLLSRNFGDAHFPATVLYEPADS